MPAKAIAQRHRAEVAFAAIFNSTREFISVFPSSYLKADDRIRTGDVQLGKLTFYH
jgi:hypothetical protein